MLEPNAVTRDKAIRVTIPVFHERNIMSIIIISFI